jgi:glycerophosphoryl diester phosphodiesterase
MDLLYTKSYMIIIGHRGARGQAPENTLASIESGLDSGVHEIEIDARVTRDGVVILLHEDSILGVKINESTHKKLLKLDPGLTTLASAIELVNRKVPIYLEVKPGVPAEPVVTLLRSYLAKGWKTTDFLVASFSWPLLLELHELLPGVPTLVNEMWSGVRAGLRARKLGTKRISMYERWLWGGFIRSVARGGYQLSAFPLNDVKKAKRWEKQGLYGVITDFPERFKGVK